MKDFATYLVAFLWFCNTSATEWLVSDRFEPTAQEIGDLAFKTPFVTHFATQSDPNFDEDRFFKDYDTFHEKLMIRDSTAFELKQVALISHWLNETDATLRQLADIVEKFQPYEVKSTRQDRSQPKFYDLEHDSYVTSDCHFAEWQVLFDRILYETCMLMNQKDYPSAFGRLRLGWHLSDLIMTEVAGVHRLRIAT